MIARVIDITPITQNISQRCDAYESIVITNYIIKVSFGSFTIEFYSRKLMIEKDYISEALHLMSVTCIQQKSPET